MAAACGAYFTLLVGADGDMYSMGKCKTEVGQGNSVGPRISKYISCFGGQQVETVAAGGASGGVVTKNGAMWNWGNKCATGRDDINLGCCPFFGHSVAMLAFGGTSCILLTKNGDVWKCGQNDHLENPEDNTFHCVHPRRFKCQKIEMVASGEFHKMAVDTHGTLWTWGDNLSGELCDKAARATRTPVEIAPETFQGQKVAHVAGGNRYTMVVTENGALWGCGASNLGQTGLGNIDRTSIPKQVGITDSIFQRFGVRMTACGQRHTLIVAMNNRLWVCGCNKNMNLGIGDPYRGDTDTCVWIPTLIPDTRNFTNENVMTVSAGYTHSVAVMCDGSVFTWGLCHAPYYSGVTAPSGTGHNHNVSVPTGVRMSR